jgi:hypothetical protein
MADQPTVSIDVRHVVLFVVGFWLCGGCNKPTLHQHEELQKRVISLEHRR